MSFNLASARSAPDDTSDDTPVTCSMQKNFNKTGSLVPLKLLASFKIRFTTFTFEYNEADGDGCSMIETWGTSCLLRPTWDRWRTGVLEEG